MMGSLVVRQCIYKLFSLQLKSGYILNLAHHLAVPSALCSIGAEKSASLLAYSSAIAAVR